jgi:hypothetical protein
MLHVEEPTPSQHMSLAREAAEPFVAPLQEIDETRGMRGMRGIHGILETLETHETHETHEISAMTNIADLHYMEPQQMSTDVLVRTGSFKDTARSHLLLLLLLNHHDKATADMAAASSKTIPASELNDF